jgi:type IV secretion system protein VirB10
VSEIERPAEALPEDPPLDRTISPIAGRLGSGRAAKAMTFASLLAGCAVFAFATWSADRPKAPKIPEQPARQVVPFEPAGAPTLAHPGAGAPSLTRADAPFVPAIEPDGADAGSVPPTETPRQSEARPSAPLMVYSHAEQASPGAAPPESPVETPAASASDLDQLRRTGRIGRARASTVGDRNFLILAGTSIPCVLQTALDSSTPGLVSCVLPQDAYSDNGAVVLMEKGTRVLGEYRGGLRQGQHRIFVVWTRAVTPNGVAVDLASPAADALGRGGFDGELDTHFWDRFGAAVLLSIVDEGAYGLAGRGDRAGAIRLPSDAAAVAVQKGADIAPTLRKAQGAQVSIFAAQDLDFSGVYGLKARTP